MSGETIDPDSRVFVYVQLAGIIRQRIESGEYAPGRRIPSLRDARSEWGVADKTWFKAVALLREEGLVETIPKHGTFVTELSRAAALPSGLVRSCARLCAHAAAPPVTSPHEPS